MRDRREELLQRLVTIAQATPGVALVARDRLDVGRSQRPAIIVLDGDETTAADQDVDRHGRPARASERVEMTPELVVMAGGEGDVNVGTVLSGLRRALISAVKTDDVLSDTVGTNGYVRYLGAVTDLARGREMEGTMVLTFALRYLLKVEELS
jgi:hypothetical protein